MNIITKRVDAKYIEIKIQVNELTHDLGLHSKEEAEDKAKEIRESLEDFDYEICLMPNDQ